MDRQVLELDDGKIGLIGKANRNFKELEAGLDAIQGRLIPTTGNIVTVVATPATAGAAGVAGQIAYDATHIYVCIATNTWVRATLATW